MRVTFIHVEANANITHAIIVVLTFGSVEINWERSLTCGIHLNSRVKHN